MREVDQVEPASILNGGDKQYMSCRLSFSVINLYFNIFGLILVPVMIMIQ
jgi:hypothetical protein